MGRAPSSIGTCERRLTLTKQRLLPIFPRASGGDSCKFVPVLERSRPMRTPFSRRSTAALALAAFACSGGVESARTPIARVVVSPANPVVEVGGSLRLIAEAQDADGRALSGRTIFW